MKKSWEIIWIKQETCELGTTRSDNQSVIWQQDSFHYPAPLSHLRVFRFPDVLVRCILPFQSIRLRLPEALVLRLRLHRELLPELRERDLAHAEEPCMQRRPGQRGATIARLREGAHVNAQRPHLSGRRERSQGTAHRREQSGGVLGRPGQRSGARERVREEEGAPRRVGRVEQLEQRDS